ncbi:MAG: insulinase family protein [Lewinellaceae bacterium]|nr:insulinase family protein [Lewinellaceae bacterium]
MKQRLLLFALLCGLSMGAFAQTKMLEKVTQRPGELVISYEKYQLANGLTLVIHEDHSDPVVHVDVTYHVGSAREEIGKSGFAHFFEHMMFQGSDNVADEEHFKIVTESGGTLNGSTNRDRTNYFETVPSNQLATALWLEADRMGFLLDAVTQPKFEVQRSTVKNERGQNYDNRPYGLAREVAAKSLYPYGHPYSWLTIGYIEDLNRVDVNDLKRFFLRWYGPNNATLTIGGDVNPKEVVSLVEKYFGSIPAGPAVNNMPAMTPVLDRDRYVSYVDNYIRFPMLMMTIPTVPAYHPDETALDCLADLLGGSKTSPMYQQLVKNQKALQASARNSTDELAGEFTISIIPSPGQTLADIEQVARQAMVDLRNGEITPEKVERFKTATEARIINSLASVRGKVTQLAAYQTFTSNPNQLPIQLKAIRALTVADVQRVFDQYIAGKPAVILSVLPKTGKVEPAAADNYTVNEQGYQAPADQYQGLTYQKPKDNFDRSKKPTAGKNPVIKVPPFWTNTMANGIKVIGTRNSETPTVSIQLSIKGGQRLDPMDKIGLASLAAQMMREGTENYSAEAFEEALEALGSSISVFAGEDGMSISLNTLVKNLDPSLKLLNERLFLSKFEAADFDRVKTSTLRGIANRTTQAATVATDVFNTLLYGKEDLRAYPTSGTEATVANITLEDVKAFYQQNLSAKLTDVVIVGDVDEKTILPKLDFLKKMPALDVAIPAMATPANPDKTRLYLVDIPKAAQSEIRIGYMGIPYDATGEYYRTYLMNYPLGGAFNSRINLNLREDKGYTYGARSGFRGTDVAGPFTASAGVRATATDSSVVEFMKEIQLYHDKGVTADELAFMKSSIGQRDALAYETGFQKAGFLRQMITYNLPKDFTVKQNEILQKITQADINALAKKQLKPDHAFIVVVGDKELIMPGLQKLGYEIIELDKTGNPMTSASGGQDR